VLEGRLTGHEATREEPLRERYLYRVLFRARGRNLVMAFDVLGATLSLVGAWLVWTRMLNQEFLWWHGILLGILGTSWVVSLAKSKVLRNRLRRSLLDDLPAISGRVLLTSMVTALGISLVWLDPDHDGLVLIAAALGVVTLSTTRGLGYLLLTRYCNIGGKQRVLVIGAGDVGTRVARVLSGSYQPSIEVVGFLDKEPLARIQGEDEAGLPVLGSSYDLKETIQRWAVNQVIIAFSTAPHQQVLEMVWECDQYGVDVSIVPRFFEATTVQSMVEDVSGVPLLHLNRVRLMGFNGLLKRIFDVMSTVIGLLVIWPVLLAVALAIKLDSPGPVIFSQKRTGVDGQQFTLYKFRSMRADAETASTWTKRQDPRRTRVGRVIRPLNVDELPQLFNVLKGDMSLVGPRPEQLSYVKLFEESVYRYTHRHRVKSGVTGWAQVNGLRGDTSIEERVLYDNFYIENWSLWLDIKIILRTLFKSGISAPELSSTVQSYREVDVTRSSNGTPTRDLLVSGHEFALNDNIGGERSGEDGAANNAVTL